MKRARHELRPLVLISGLAPGGAERVTVSFVCRLRRAGANVPLCTLASRHEGPLAAELRRADVVRHDLRARRMVDAGALARLVHLLRRERFDVIHAHGQDAAVLASLACGLTGVPLVVTRHVLDEPRAGWRHRARARASLAALRRARALVAVSRATAEAVARLTGKPRDAIQVILNGIELERFARFRDRDRIDLRASLGIPSHAPLVLVPAVLRDGKGHDVLLDALPHIRRAIPSLTVACAGTGPLESALRERARAHGDTVRFLGHRDDVPALLHAADLVVLPSLEEALPTALMEAAAAGRAVVSTRVGGVPEIVDDGRTGILVPPSDPLALAEAVSAVLGDRGRVAAFGQAARSVAAHRFDIDAQIHRTWRLWTRVARAGARA